ncbi:MAG TPA: SRPBCC family protein [Burkholderiales bacterium]|nr:SRPBCC family protein [Burkholderiales bacterium]
MNPLFLGGAAVGLALMYFLDPNSGRRRRARTRDKVVRAARVVNEGAKVTARDTLHRAQGAWAEARRLFNHEEAVDDEALIGRVRAELGRVVSHPHAIEVAADGGHIALIGPILSYEVRPLLKSLRRVAGVRAVSDQLTVYNEPGNVSALQGGEPRSGERFELLQENWSPAARVLVGGVGATLMLAATRARGGLCALLGVSGGALVARAASNRDLASLLGFGRRGISVQKTIYVAAAIERVFHFWTDYQNFPRFMHNVRDVRQLPDNRSHWVVAGPAGVPVQWTAEVTRVIPGELIEWRSISDSDVRHEGEVHFVGTTDGGTRISVRLSYLPPAGAFGHAVATMFGADPKSEMEADLLRMKSMIETGHAPHDAAQPGALPRES